MTDKARLVARFDRVLKVLGDVIDSITALDSAFEEMKKGVEGAYAKAALSCSEARQAFEDEMPTMDALAIELKDMRYKDPSWQTENAKDAQTLRYVWHCFHKVIVAGKSFTPDDVSAMRNLYAAIKRAAAWIESHSQPGIDLLPRPGKTMPKKPAEHPEWLEWQNSICEFTNANKLGAGTCWDQQKTELQDIAGVVDRNEFLKIHGQLRERRRPRKK